MAWAYVFLATLHVLAGAAWFGAILDSFAVLHPRARAFFQSPGQCEALITWTAAGARWKVLGGCLFIALTGVGLLLFPRHSQGFTLWHGCITAQGVLFAIAAAVFCYASWVRWPARLLASPSEIPKHQKVFRIVAITMRSVVGLRLMLGTFAHRG